MNKLDVINFLRPGAHFVVRGETVEWHDTTQTQPSEAEILGALNLVAVAQARAAKIAEIQVACTAAIEVGIDSSALGTLHHYPATKIDQQNMAALALNAQVAGATYSAKFWCANGAGVWARRSHTAAQLINVGQAMTVHVQSKQGRYETLLAQVNAAQTVPEITAIVW